MRVNASGDAELQQFDEWTMSIGNGDTASVNIPPHMVVTEIKPNTKENPQSEVQAMKEFCSKVFPDLETNISDRNWLEGRLILATTNKEVSILNEMITDMLPGSAEVFRSADQLDNSQDLLRFNVEYLNSLTPNGFPPHNLLLKPGMPLMLLRNINPMQGLCNGTKMVFEQAYANKVLQCRLIESGQKVLIPWIMLIPKENEYPFNWQRRQFPVKPAFSVTINKSQGNFLSS